MEQKQSEYKLSMAVYNGIMLALVGILVAATPFTTEIPAHQLKIVYISGGGLVVGGLAAIAFGLVKKQH